MEGKRLRWTIAGQIHSTFTTSRYFETRVASFSGEIDERLRPMEDTKGKDKDAEKGKKSEKKEIAEIDDKNKDSEKGEVSKSKLGKINTSMRTDFEEYLEFKRYKEERMRMMGEGQSTQASNNEGEFKEDTVRESADAARVKKYGSSHDEIEENTVNLKLDPEEGRSSLQVRPSLVRVKANNGRWQEMEDLSPPHEPQVGVDLRGTEDEDLYPASDFINGSQGQIACDVEKLTRST